MNCVLCKGGLSVNIIQVVKNIFLGVSTVQGVLWIGCCVLFVVYLCWVYFFVCYMFCVLCCVLCGCVCYLLFVTCYVFCAFGYLLCAGVLCLFCVVCFLNVQCCNRCYSSTRQVLMRFIIVNIMYLHQIIHWTIQYYCAVLRLYSLNNI